MDSLLQDLRYAARVLRRSPLFTLTAALSVAVGVGADTTVFSLANAVLFRQPAMVREPDRLVDISRQSHGGPVIGFISYPQYRSARARFTAFDGIYAHDLVPKPMNLIDADGTAERVSGNIVTANYFDVLGVPAAAGRLLHAADGDAPGTGAYVVLSHRYWVRRFGGNPSVIGRPITINGQPVAIIGVAAEGFQGTTLLAPDVWIPTVVGLNGPMATTVELLLGGRLKPNVSLAQARSDVRSVSEALDREDGSGSWQDIQVTALAAIPAAALPAGPFFVLVLVAVSLLLAIACANLTSSLLARATARRGEFTIRAALGAPRVRVVRQLLIETALLFLIGGSGGVLIARTLSAAIAPLTALAPLPINLSFPVDWRVFAFSMGLALAAGLASGLLPALRASSAATLRIETHRLRHAFLVAQIALAIVLVVSAGLLGQALRNATAVDVGYDPQGLHYAAVNLSLSGSTPPSATEFARALQERVRRLPTVTAATAAATVPMGDPIIGLGAVTHIGEPVPERERGAVALGNAVEPGYFATMGIPLVAGRDFTGADTEPVAIVGDATARRLFPGGRALGQSIVIYQNRVELRGGVPQRRPSNPVTVRIVGVARDVKYISLASGTTPTMVYVPLHQQPATNFTLVVRAARDARVDADIRAAVATLNPALPIALRTADDNLALALFPQRIAAIVSGALGLIGLALAAIGIYGVMAYSVARRTQEIAIRVAVGAGRREVAALILRQGLALAAIGGAVGLVLAGVSSQVMRRLLFGVPPLDPFAFGGTTLLFVLVTLLACYLPTLRASQIAPAGALRTE